ncbi:unnamed protein product [Darwinula stevensoni]|uniref:Kringle domain-containing protein n=1 Tax=Darwinula stevensoni TaxID=69355 RepID=A0A7R9A9Q1_9CRUS|nr:unnamed protein product [Darwinula stevensoni]CAG0897519.1 unnamed protein product [Darwinula stevensoni]
MVLTRMAVPNLFLLILRLVASKDFIFHHAAHSGWRYENVSFETTAPTLGICGIKCVTQTPPCYAFNYRESDGSCQVVLNGESGLVEADGYISFAQWLCLTEHPTIPNTKVSFEGWRGEYPAPKGAMVTLLCDDPKGFSDGSPHHTSRCSSVTPHAWESSFQVDAVECKENPNTVYFLGLRATCLYWKFTGEKQYIYPECRLTEKGREYIGTERQTESGKTCLRWDTQPYGKPDDFLATVEYDDHFLNRDAWSQQNYCRNPSWKARPWCFVDDTQVQWEFCNISMCTVRDPPEFKMTQEGGEYIGRKNVTISGLPCQPWNTSKPYPASDEVASHLPGFPDAEDIDEDHNFCRNPNGDAAPWCYSEKLDDPGTEFCDIPFKEAQIEEGAEGNTFGKGKGIHWDKVDDPGTEFCDIPFKEVQIEEGAEGNVYPECRLSEKGKEFIGTKSETETGKPCLVWSEQKERTPWDFSWSGKEYYHLNFLGGDPATHENFCRNPGIYRERPWCFVSDADIKWEYCDIPICHDPKPLECKLTEKGGEYVGKKNVTLSGFPCWPWLSGAVFSFDFRDKLSAFSDEVDGNHNYCRNPEPGRRNHGPYCYFFSGSTMTWEYCDVPFCPGRDGEQCNIRVYGKCISPAECKTTQSSEDYTGTKQTTKSGLPCQPWLRNSPNDLVPLHSLKKWKFPDELHPSHNFCRNPDADAGGPWCYNGAGTDPRWEHCDVPSC